MEVISMIRKSEIKQIIKKLKSKENKYEPGTSKDKRGPAWLEGYVNGFKEGREKIEEVLE